MLEPKSHRNRRHADGIGEPLWTLGKGPKRLSCEPFDNGQTIKNACDARCAKSVQVVRLWDRPLASVSTPDARNVFIISRMPPAMAMASRWLVLLETAARERRIVWRKTMFRPIVVALITMSCVCALVAVAATDASALRTKL